MQPITPLNMYVLGVIVRFPLAIHNIAREVCAEYPWPAGILTSSQDAKTALFTAKAAVDDLLAAGLCISYEKIQKTSEAVPSLPGPGTWIPSFCEDHEIAPDAIVPTMRGLSAWLDHEAETSPRTSRQIVDHQGDGTWVFVALERISLPQSCPWRRGSTLHYGDTKSSQGVNVFHGGVCNEKCDVQAIGKWRRGFWIEYDRGYLLRCLCPRAVDTE